jgi:aminopeptidase-like protein
VIVGIKTISELLKRAELRYTYRLLVLPETIGSIAYLSHNENLIPKMKGGLYLEMLGLENPHGLQLSFDGNTDLDLCLSLALKQHDYHGWTGAYRTVIGNDERQFNGPGLRVPMLSLSRVLPDSSPNYPYREYHSSYDNPDLMKVSRLEDSIALVLRMIDTIEGNLVPVNKFKGEVFCSRYGVFVDPYSNPRGHRKLFNIMDHIDGTRSLAEIARACDAPFDAVRGVIDELHGHGLVDYR